MGMFLRTLYAWFLRLTGSRAVTVGTGVYIGSMALPSADDFSNLIGATEGPAKQWGNFIKVLAWLLIVLAFRKPLANLVTKLVKKI